MTDIYEYSAFGECLSGKDSVNAYRFVGGHGGMADDDTGLVLFHNRWYDPQTGRWTSEDPVRWQAQDKNFLEYVGNNPALAIDPDGLNWYYSQGTGEFSHPPYKTVYARSGNNISSDEGVKDVGPIPRGTWNIEGPPHDYVSPNLTFHHALHLSPLWDVTTTRHGFFMHSGGKTEGCLLTSSDFRDEVWNSGDHLLTVTQ